MTNVMMPPSKNPESIHANAPKLIPSAPPTVSARRRDPPCHAKAGTVTTV
jgi:hypothetical protein